MQKGTRAVLHPRQAGYLAPLLPEVIKQLAQRFPLSSHPAAAHGASTSSPQSRFRRRLSLSGLSVRRLSARQVSLVLPPPLPPPLLSELPHRPPPAPSEVPPLLQVSSEPPLLLPPLLSVTYATAATPVTACHIAMPTHCIPVLVAAGAASAPSPFGAAAPKPAGECERLRRRSVAAHSDAVSDPSPSLAGVFGAPTGAAGGLFGAAPAAVPGFGQPAASPFGAATPAAPGEREI